MTLAQQMMDRWLRDKQPIESPEALARAIDPRVHTHGYLYTEAKRFVFPDGSKAFFANNCLTLKGF